MRDGPEKKQWRCKNHVKANVSGLKDLKNL